MRSILLFAVLIMSLVVFLAGCSQETGPEPAVEPIKEGSNMKLASPAFEQEGMIPSKHTCDGEDINPELNIEDIPEGAKSLALIVDDPDASAGTWLHWIVWNIPADKKTIEEGSVPGLQGTNDFKKTSYGGPCPPSGTHRYFFRLYALDTELDLSEGASREELENAMEGRIIEKTELMAKYSKT